MANRDFIAGVNLGGWISQYRTYNKEHFDTFITERDVEQIASWGMDHIRLPFDYPVIEDDEHPGEYKESGLHYIDQCLEWCSKRNLGLILDLHKAPGYSFGTLDSNTLFTDESMKQRFIRIWEMFAKRYRSEGDMLQLELLNEVVEPGPERWNQLAHRTVAAIREIDDSRKIVFGGNFYNSIDQLKEIELVPGDDNIVYNFHFYKPMLVTHQKAPWVPFLNSYNHSVEYPGEAPQLEDFLNSHPEMKDNHMKEYLPETMDSALMEKYIEPAADFIAKTGKPLYCGEFGVIDRASMETRIRWHQDVTDIFSNLGIGRAVWTYKAMDFGLVDREGRIASEELVRVTGRK